MKKLIIIFTIPFMLFYLMFSFIKMEYNVIKWSEDVRFVFIIISSLFGFMSLMIHNDFE